MKMETVCGLSFARGGCALKGAVEAARAVKGFIPILHTTAGCSLRDPSGQAGELSPSEIPNTELLERQVIFGGISRLREQVRNTIHVFEGDLYLIIPGCAAEMIGDDIDFIVREMRGSGYPVIKVDTAGFKGTASDGYVQFATDVLAFLSSKKEKCPDANTRPVINIWGVLPGFEPYWEGDLAELNDLLEAVGFRVTRLFGPGSSISEWALIPSASLNLAVSPWGGKIARRAKETFGTPFLELPGLPAGPEQEKELFRALAAFFGQNADLLRAQAEKDEAGFRYALSRASTDYIRYGFQKTFAVAAESARAFPLLRYFSETIGDLPRALVIPDLSPDTLPETVCTYCTAHGIALLASDDRETIRAFLISHRPDVIFGSVLEADAARQAGALLIEASSPSRSQVVLTGGSTGCRGILHLTERLFTHQKEAALRRRSCLSDIRLA